MKNRFLVVAAALTAAFVGPVHAALPAGIASGLTSIQADMTSLVDLVWPAVIASVAATVIFKLFQRFASKI
jgi:uncharacterized membrane protein